MAAWDRHVLIGSPAFPSFFYEDSRMYALAGDLSNVAGTYRAHGFHGLTGASLAATDLEGDGVPELSVGAPGEDTYWYTGAAYLLEGLPSGDLYLDVEASLVLRGEKFEFWGSSVCFADLIGAGGPAWVVSGYGAAHQDVDGAVVVIDPTRTGTLTPADADQMLTGGPGFGARTAAWDGDGDGIVDLVVTDADAAVVRFASPLDAVVPEQAETRWTTTGPEPDFYPLGDVGDVTGDGLPDLGLGDRTWQSSVDRGGAAYVVAGGDTMSHTAAEIPLQWQGTETGEAWGASMAGGDLDGDGQRDLVVGAMGLWPGVHPGLVAGYLGPVTSLDPANAAFVIYGTDVGGYFGVSTLLFDPDDDGADDLYVGANNEEYGHGAVYRFLAPTLLAL